jgi:hypothetical protein
VIRELKEAKASLTENLSAVTAELATARGLEAAAKQMCESVRCESEETRRQMRQELAGLRAYLEKFTPHRRFFRATLGFFIFFAASISLKALLGVTIVESPWAPVGIIFTSAMLIVIYFGKKDDQSRTT